MFMDGASRFLYTLPVSSQPSQIHKFASSPTASPRGGFFHRIDPFNVLCTHQIHWPLERKPVICTYIGESKKQKCAMVHRLPCSTKRVAIWPLPKVCDYSGCLNRSQKRLYSDRKELSFQQEGSADLELEILKFMENSDKPASFPTKLELLRAGRTDLVDAVLAKGGWLTAGWELECDCREKTAVVQPEDASIVGTVAKQTPNKHAGEPKIINGDGQNMVTDENRQVSKERKDACKLSANQASGSFYPTTAMLQEEQNLIQGNLGPEPQGGPLHGLTLVDRKRGWEQFAKLFGLAKSLRKPEHGGETAISDNHAIAEESVYGRNPVLKGKNTADSYFLRNGRGPHKRPRGGRQNLDAATPVKSKSKKKKRRKSLEDEGTVVNLNQAFDRINEKVDRRNDWLLKVKSSSQEAPDWSQYEKTSLPISTRIHGLESKLIETLSMIQSGRRALTHNNRVKQVNDLALVELEKASDALEFRETELMRICKELRTTRAQLAALEGKFALELIEAQKKIEEKDKRLAETTSILKNMRTARIVWPMPASEVLLAGSFDGWTSQIKMQKSSAGVFVTALQLYPGRYEIKFIVNGEWRVDPNRPIIHANGFENNVLTIV